MFNINTDNLREEEVNITVNNSGNKSPLDSAIDKAYENDEFA